MSIDLILTCAVLLAGLYMAWNIGANDVSNAMGTSIGSGALSLLSAVVIAGVLEFCGAFFLGGNVSHTLQRGVVDPSVFSHDPSVLLYGMLSSLIATALWLNLASYLGWPVSTTHAIVGALLGFGAIIGGMHAVHWKEVGKIALSWVISPALSALFAFLIFSVLQKKVLFAMHPVKASKRLIPYLTSVVLFVFILSFSLGGRFRLLSTYDILLIAFSISLLAYFVARILVKRVKDPTSPSHHYSTQQIQTLRKSIRHLDRLCLSAKNGEKEELIAIAKRLHKLKKEMQKRSNFYSRSSDYQVVEKLFAALQILSAAYVAFAHGANDVANAIGPVAAALEILKHKTLSLATPIPTYLLALGGGGIVLGLATWGWRVIETIGKKITALTPTRGFSAEFGAAVTILFASKLGLPISTTHCIVGAVLGVGLARGIAALNLRMIRDIVLSWVITIPSSALVCILIFHCLKLFFL